VEIFRKKRWIVVIRVQGLGVEYDGEWVLRDVSFAVESGEFVFLTGKSGAGKSTLLKVLYRDVERSEGEVWLDGKEVRERERHLLRREVGVIFQGFELLERKSALENVMLAGEIMGRKEAEVRAEALRMLKRVGLRGKEERRPHQLSGGEQQRVAIARALLNQPKVLLADEPTGNLDRESADGIWELLWALHQEGMTVLAVTHDQGVLERFAGRRLVVEQGRVMEG
jgi:cell division transport system ATP-binding protein